jgi:hypothetical protein
VDASEIDGAEACRHASHEDVGGDRQVGDEADFLRHHADAGAKRVARRAQTEERAGEANLAGVGSVHAHQDANERRLPRAVLARQGVHLAGVDVEVDAAQRVCPGEALVKAARGEERDGGRRRHPVSRVVRDRRPLARAQRPRGEAMNVPGW